MDCPRCCRPSHSNEQLDPPWTGQRIPPARLLKELFEQQRSDTDALRARIANLEKRFKIWPLIVLSIVVLIRLLQRDVEERRSLSLVFPDGCIEPAVTG